MLRLRYFGEIADKIGKTEEEIMLKETSVAALMAFIEKRYSLQENDFQIAVNRELVNSKDAILLHEKDEIALLSAFAGG